MLSRQDRRQVILIYIVGFITFFLTVATAYKIVYEPLRHELRLLHQELTDETPGSIQGFGASLGAYEPWLAALSLTQDQLRSELIEILSKSHVQLAQIRFDEQKKEKPFSELPIFLKVRGNFSSLIQFFVALSNAHLLFDFEKLALTKHDSMIQSTMTLRFRMFE